MKKVLIITGDAAETLEVFYPYYRFLEEGFEAVVASPKKKKLHLVVHDMEDWETYTEKRGYTLQSHASFSEIKPEEFDALFIPGGRAPEYIRLDENISRIVGHFFETNKPIGVVCHGVQVLVAVRPKLDLSGRRMTAYIACKPDVESLGAQYVNEGVVVDGNIVSAFAWPNLPQMLREFMKLLRG
ncbi:DJ-1/PfpI family protein [Thermocrinis minervae]|uniref:Protease I n=1 Tax=Thermocrinis minervae TaxID=381751 RepID=A0A1M6QDP7_9AQUI|nr:DJ-1/PfpI family protein [Thermocrinis minervae]SHK18362.1 protease I [Thermocrinis minervae]